MTLTQTDAVKNESAPAIVLTQLTQISHRTCSH